MVTLLLMLAIQEDMRTGVDALPVSVPRDAVHACVSNELSKGNSVVTRSIDGGVILEARFRSMIGAMGGRSVFEIRDAPGGVAVTTRYQHPQSQKSAIGLLRYIGGKCFKDDFNKWAVANGQKPKR